MAQFLNATKARGEIESIITNAKYTIVMISPYIKINDDLIKRLTYAGKMNVKVLIVCREQDLKLEERTKIEQIPNIKLKFNERVHAKCFYNDESMVITSLNLYDSSLGDNREMGILLRNDLQEDKKSFQEAKLEAEFIIQESALNSSHIQHSPQPYRTPQFIIREAALNSSHSNPQFIPREKSMGYNIDIIKTDSKPKYDRTPVKEQHPEDSIIKGISNFLGLRDEGHCVRCGEAIPLNIDAPYCNECYKTWAKYKDNTYKEKYCHKCGHPADTSMKYPLCSACYKKSK